MGVLVLGTMGAAILVSIIAEEYFYTHAILIMTRLPVFILGTYMGKLCMTHRKIPAIIPLLTVPISVLPLVVIADKPLPDYWRFFEYSVFVPCIVLAHAFVFSKIRKRGFLFKFIVVIGSYSMEIYLIYESIYNHATSLFHQIENTGLVYALTVFTATLVLAVLLRMVVNQLTREYDIQDRTNREKEEGINP